MSEKSQLEWVALNRRRNATARRIGSHLVGLVEAVERRESIVEEVASALLPVVDDEFCEFCRIAGVEKGVLRLAVGDLGAVSTLSRKWSEKIRRVLPGRLRVRRVTFAFGTDGYRLEKGCL